MDPSAPPQQRRWSSVRQVKVTILRKQRSETVVGFRPRITDFRRTNSTFFIRSHIFHVPDSFCVWRHSSSSLALHTVEELDIKCDEMEPISTRPHPSNKRGEVRALTSEAEPPTLNISHNFKWAHMNHRSQAAVCVRVCFEVSSS